MRTISTTFAAAALALMACGGGPKKAATLSSTGGGRGGVDAEAAGFRDGALWACQISDYDPQPCKLSRAGGGWQLAKVLGSQRFAGRLQERGMALAFEGEFFCPWGDCTQPMAVDFEPDGNDGYVAEFTEDKVHLRYDAALDSEFGAAGYGGLTGREQ